MSGDRSSVAGIRATVAATAKDFVVQCMWQKTKNFLANIKTLISMRSDGSTCCLMVIEFP
jgi:hypothetical protein